MSLVVQAQAVIAQSMGKRLSVTGGNKTHISPGNVLWRSCPILSFLMPSSVWIAFGWFGIVASGISCPLISISSCRFCWQLPMLLCYRCALVWMVVCVPWTPDSAVLVWLLGNLCRAHQLQLQLRWHYCFDYLKYREYCAVVGWCLHFVRYEKMPSGSALWAAFRELRCAAVPC